MPTKFFFLGLCVLFTAAWAPELSYAQTDSSSAKQNTKRKPRANTDERQQELNDLLDEEESDGVEVEADDGDVLPSPSASEETSPVLESQGEEAATASPEELFLPIPSDQSGLPSGGDVGASSDFQAFSESGDVRHDNDLARTGLEKPGFALWGGYVQKEYPAGAELSDPRNGFEFGVSARLFKWDVVLPISFHIFGAASFIATDTVGEITGVKDRTFRLGALLEAELGRRVQLIAGLSRYSTEFEAKFANTAGATLRGLDEDRISPGVGLQFELLVKPHASLGVRGWVEPRYTSLLLTFSLEPVPRKRGSLNFDWEAE